MDVTVAHTGKSFADFAQSYRLPESHRLQYPLVRFFKIESAKPSDTESQINLPRRGLPCGTASTSNKPPSSTNV
jgi:hypothetical protein